MKKLITTLTLCLSSLFTVQINASTSLMCHINEEIPVLGEKTQNLNPQVLRLALTAYNCAVQDGLDKQRLLTIIDYSLPDTEKRMWVFNLATNQVLFNSLVAHGQGSGDILATKFSDRPETHESSLGLFITDGIYEGHDGYSLRIMGLDKGFNDLASEREIVIHGAPYVSENFVKRYGRLGRSWGCPAVSKDMIKPIADTIKNGTLVFAYYPNKLWLQDSIYLHCKNTDTSQNTKTSLRKFF